MREAIEITTENFDEHIIDDGSPILVEFWQHGDPACRIAEPHVQQFLEAHPDLRFGRIEIIEQLVITGTFQVRAVPQFVLFKNGQAVDSIIGAAPVETFEDLIAGRRKGTTL